MSKIPMYDSKGAELSGFDLPDALLVQDKGGQAVH